MPRADIARKASDIAGDLAQLRARRLMLAEVGLAVHADVDAQIGFQQARLEAALWAVDATDEEVRARLEQAHAELGVWVAAKYGSQAGVPPAIVQRIAVVELWELALGAHPVQTRQRRRRS